MMMHRRKDPAGHGITNLRDMAAMMMILVKRPSRAQGLAPRAPLAPPTRPLKFLQHLLAQTLSHLQTLLLDAVPTRSQSR